MAGRRGNRVNRQQSSSTLEEDHHDTDSILSPNDRRSNEHNQTNDAIIASGIRTCLDAFDSDEIHTLAMKFLFKKGLALGLFTRGEAIDLLKERPSDDAACDDDDSAVTRKSPDSQPKTKKKPKTASPADNLAKKNKSILGSFGCGGLRVDKLIRCLNNALISFGSAMKDYQNLQW